MKRTRDRLTGGTNDVNPQWYTLPTLTQNLVNTFVQAQVPTPISRMNNGQRGNTATVMEVLKVMVNLPAIDQTFDTTFSRKNSQVVLSTASLSNTGITLGPTVFDYHFVTYAGVISDLAADQQFALYYQNPSIHDLTDGDGHGILIATDSIYFGGGSQGFATLNAWNVKILYRFKEVTLTEYIGIVQSQQSPAGTA